ncbi:MAG TPA: sn-glycerol-3-phosphate ABC transporter ATP-binding protein UgpC [Gaiella sp.]|nr:sn-glycerol-3-phosphate ABC transporter ATP-binding protein UgpC [Gaiella sp.]
MATIEIDHVTKVFGNDVVAVDDISLSIQDGEFLVLVGPSGCGKSTLLRMLAGLEEVTAGAIRIDGKDVTDLAPRHRDIAMVFQSYALYPHMTVRENLGYGLKVRRAPKQESRQRVAEVAELLGLEDLLDRRPAQLSGGQRQRVAMGRAIVRQPRAFLMDEPLSNLDAKLRVGMRASLAQLHARLGVTTIYVTHDQTEAMTLGQRVAVLRDGRIVQVDRPQELYARPRDVFVAAFIGSPAMNLVEATVDDGLVRFGQYTLTLDSDRRPPASGPVVLGIRPEAFTDAGAASPELPRIDVTVEVVEELGADTHVCFWVEANRPDVDAGDDDRDDATLPVGQKTLFTARIDPRFAPAVGTRHELAVDTTRLHFFDPATGAALASGTDQVEPTRAEPLSVE